MQAPASLPPVPSAEVIEGWIAALQGLGGADLADSERIDLIRVLERLNGATAGAQAELTADFDVSQRAKAAAAGEPPARQGRGIAHQVALARRESPHRGQTHLSLAKVLRTELHATAAALRAGRITEWRAALIARETTCLSLEDRRRVDAEVAGDPAALEALGERELVGRLRQRVAALDPAAVAQRRRRAEADRHTTLRPAPDTMTWFTACLPVKHGVAVHAALLREADRLKAAGDPRSRGQIMADTLVQRVLRPHLAGATATTGGTGSGGAVGSGGAAGLPLMINLVVPDGVLHGRGDGAGEGGGGFVEGYGEVPDDLLAEWVADHLEGGLEVWLRRLYARPATGELIAMDSRARRYPRPLAAFLRLRDRRCRTPWCDAPIRQLDHAEEHDAGGETSEVNGQGLCESCNHAKQARGWRARPRPGPRHTIETTTPTGHTYTSTAPPTGARARRRRRLKLHLVHGGPELVYDPDAA